MPSCLKCGASPPPDAVATAGWRRIEFYGPTGPKYGFYCPNETPAAIAADVHAWASVSRTPSPAPEKKRKGTR